MKHSSLVTPEPTNMRNIILTILAIFFATFFALASLVQAYQSKSDINSSSLTYENAGIIIVDLEKPRKFKTDEIYVYDSACTETGFMPHCKSTSTYSNIVREAAGQNCVLDGIQLLYLQSRVALIYSCPNR